MPSRPRSGGAVNREVKRRQLDGAVIHQLDAAGVLLKHEETITEKRDAGRLTETSEYRDAPTGSDPASMAFPAPPESEL